VITARRSSVRGGEGEIRARIRQGQGLDAVVLADAIDSSTGSDDTRKIRKDLDVAHCKVTQSY
jgi:hypothetical protein